MPFDDLFADRESDTGAVKFLPLVQPLKHAEYSFEKLRFNPESVVLNGEHPFVPVVRRGPGT